VARKVTAYDQVKENSVKAKATTKVRCPARLDKLASDDVGARASYLLNVWPARNGHAATDGALIFAALGWDGPACEAGPDLEPAQKVLAGCDVLARAAADWLPVERLDLLTAARAALKAGRAAHGTRAVVPVHVDGVPLSAAKLVKLLGALLAPRGAPFFVRHALHGSGHALLVRWDGVGRGLLMGMDVDLDAKASAARPHLTPDRDPTNPPAPEKRKGSGRAPKGAAPEVNVDPANVPPQGTVWRPVRSSDPLKADLVSRLRAAGRAKGGRVTSVKVSKCGAWAFGSVLGGAGDTVVRLLPDAPPAPAPAPAPAGTRARLKALRFEAYDDDEGESWWAQHLLDMDARGRAEAAGA
jgi:hypothetical protein